MKRYIAAFLCIFLFSCGERSSSLNQLKLNIQHDPPTLDPRIGGEDHSAFVINFLFDPLMRIGKDGKATFCVAKDVDISGDRCTYTFHLRKSYWSNGDRLTAHDFEYAWKSLLAPSFQSLFAYELFVIKNALKAHRGEVAIDEIGVKALDDSTLQVVLERPAPYFLELTSHSPFFPINRKVVLDDESWALKQGKEFVCNGAFTLSKWNHHDAILLEKNNTYWQSEEIHFPTVKLSMIDSPNAQIQLFEQKELDWVGRPMSSLPLELIKNQTSKLHSLPVPAVTWCEINTQKEHLENSKLRRALAMAVNREEIIQNILGGEEESAFSIVPPTIWNQQNRSFTDGNIKEAKQLFNEACQEGAAIKKLTLIFSHTPLTKSIATILQNTWQDAFGIEVELVMMEWKTFFDRRESRQFDICLLSWLSGFNDPICTLDVFTNVDNALNVTGWEDVHYRNLINLSSFATNIEFREKILRLASETLMDQMPIIPLFYDRDYYLKHNYLKNVEISETGWVDFRKGFFEG